MTSDHVQACSSKAAAAIIAGNQLTARLNVEGALGDAGDNVDTWLLYAWTSDSPAAAEMALDRAIELDPNNELAIAGQRWVKGIHALVKKFVEQNDQESVELNRNDLDNDITEEPNLMTDDASAESSPEIVGELDGEPVGTAVIEEAQTPLETPPASDNSETDEACAVRQPEVEFTEENTELNVSSDAFHHKLEGEDYFEAEPTRQMQEEQEDQFEAEAGGLKAYAEPESETFDTEPLSPERRSIDQISDSQTAVDMPTTAQGEHPSSDEMSPATFCEQSNEPAIAQSLTPTELDSQETLATEEATKELTQEDQQDQVETESAAATLAGSTLEDDIRNSLQEAMAELQRGNATCTPVVAPAEKTAIAVPIADNDGHQQVGQPVALVVDSSPPSRKLASMILSRDGFKVLLASDGVEALETLSQQQPDIVLSTTDLPELGGYKLCKIIRKQDKTKSIPVLLMSGKDGVFDKMRGKMVGCNGYITKPFESAGLTRSVREQLLLTTT